jgi:hypothetical protein
MRKLILFTIVLLISQAALTDEVFLKCNYNGEIFEESNEAAKMFTIIKPKIKIGLGDVLLKVNTKEKFLKMTIGNISNDVPINFENDKFYYWSSDEYREPSSFKMIEPSLDLSDLGIKIYNWVYEKSKKETLTQELEDLNSVGINFQKYDKISAWRIISIDRMTLETKSSVLYEGVSRSTKMIEAIGIYTYKLKCKKTEQLL